MKNLTLKVLTIWSTFLLLSGEIYAQRIAVMEFKAGVGVSLSDVDGLSSIFITYFSPGGYTLVERTQLDRVIDEQKFQRGSMTESQMVKVGQILNLSKIVVGNINVIMGEYNVDVRVINVETGTIVATEGLSFAQASYRENMKNLALNLASQISNTPATPAIKFATNPERFTLAVIKNGLRFYVTKDQYYELEGNLTGYVKEGIVIGYVSDGRWRYAILSLKDNDEGAAIQEQERFGKSLIDKDIDISWSNFDFDELNSYLVIFGGDRFEGNYWTNARYKSSSSVRSYFLDTYSQYLREVCSFCSYDCRNPFGTYAKTRGLYKL